MAQATQKQRAAAYVPWGTFRNSLNTLSKNGMPNEVNKSVFIGLAGGTQSQLVAAMKFLGLVREEDDTPTETLKRLVKQDENERKELLKEVFQAAYPDLFALNLKRTTPETFLEQLGESYGVSGSTRRKAANFFLRGAEEIGIEVSPYLKKAGKAVRSTSNKRRKKKPRTNTPAAPQESGTSKTVELESGGTLTLSATLDLFSLSSEDRKFVFKLIDELDQYEQEQASTGDEELDELLEDLDDDEEGEQ